MKTRRTPTEQSCGRVFLRRLLPAPYGDTRESVAELGGGGSATIPEVFPKVIFAPRNNAGKREHEHHKRSFLADARAAEMMAETGAYRKDSS
ncbi:MAG: hypothetical protein V8T87_13150 [Victivallales bacterium]